MRYIFDPIAALFLILAVAAVGVAHAQEPGPPAKPTAAPAPTPTAVVKLWPDGKMPGKGAHAPETDQPQKSDGVQRITNVSEPTLALFPAPGAATKAAPTLIVCPGGGYSYVTYNKEGTEIAAWLNAAGISALVLKYRTPNNRVGALQDMQRALSLARAHAAEWNIDPRRLGVIGFSAGGNLAAKASTLFAHRSYDPIDAADKESCRPEVAVLVYPAYLEQDGKIATDLDMKADIPPTLIVHSDDDHTFIAGSRLYHAALDEAKKPNTFLCYPTGGHGYGLHCTRDARAWPDAALAWLHKNGIP